MTPERDGGGEPEGPLVARLRERYGAEVDPGISLWGEPARPAEGGSEGSGSGVLGRLAARGPRTGRYRLEGEVARGGMGAILAVWDADLRRKLAMKVVLARGEEAAAGSGEVDPRVLARFLEEAQVTGQLDHPGIVPVHELGLDDAGRVFFTMPLVRGRDLDQVMRLVDAEREGWSTTRALGVLHKVCEAMAYAHSKGVVHRDLKPANVMVGRFGEVYVMDWGLARVRGHADRHDLRPTAGRPGSVDLVATDPREGSSEAGEELYTMDGDVIGTPAYMAPEQGRGELAALDARTDVYSAGAMLYRLLAGTAPYVPRGERRPGGQVLMDLLEGPPEPLERLAPEAPPELAAICHKAMAREPADRYADMQELGEDLRAFLEHRVVRAYETGAVAEARKWVRRNKPLAAALAAAVVLLVAGLVASLALKGRADESAALAEERRGEAERSAALAEQRRVEAVASAGLAEARRVEAEESAADARRQARVAAEVNAFLNDDLLAALAPEHEGIDVTVRAVLEAAAGRLEGRFPAEPLVEAELRMTIGTSFDRLGEYERARPHLERALALRRAELGERAEPTLRALRAVAAARARLGLRDEALELYAEALEIARTELGPESRASLSTASDMGIVLSDAGRVEEARALYAETLAVQRRVLGPDHPDTLSTQNNLGIALQRLGRPGDAEPLLREALELRRERSGPRHPETLNALNNLALGELDLGRLAEAEALFREAHEIRVEVLGPEHPLTARGMGSLANVWIEQGRLAEGAELFRQALEIFRRQLGEDHPDTLLATNNLAVAYARQGRSDLALPLRLATLAGQKATLGPRHFETLLSMNNLGVLYRNLRRYDDAERVYRETLELQREVLGADHPRTLATYENLSGLYFARGETERCEPILLEVLEGRERALGADHPDVAKTLYNLAMVRNASGDAEGAADLFDEVLVRNRAALGDVHPNVADTLRQLGDLRKEADDLDAALAAWREALAIHRALDTGESENAAYLLHQIGWALQFRAEYEAALEPYAESLALRRRLLGDDDETTLITMFSLARTLRRAGHLEECEPLAIEFYERTQDRGPDHTWVENARNLLVEVYEALGRPEDAELWR